MKGVIIIILILCGSCNKDIVEIPVDCTDTTTCELIKCDGSIFGFVEVSICDVDSFEDNCCPIVEEIKCICR